MKKISLGKGMDLDIEVLLRTRALIQANSGGGKSWILRRIAEQLYGKVQVIIIDKEGEFSTLREKFGFVLVGEGGETPADVRSAAMVAEKLLELKASAVCDLFESFRKNPQGRHTWVKNFCGALLDAPKKLWHPLVLIIDEFHTFVPEKGDGESEASENVIGIGTAGRKRGYCLIGATQRLSKVRKDVTAEMLNRLVGPTFEDVDLQRAANLLSVTNDDKAAFFASMRTLEPGNFYALGRALCKQRTLFKVGPVTTTHPEMGEYSLEPPPAPEKVRKLLPQLSDLPKQAEEKARTVADFQKRIRELESQLRIVPRAVVDPAIAKAAARAALQQRTIAETTTAYLNSCIAKQRTRMRQAVELLNFDVPDLPSKGIEKRLNQNMTNALSAAGKHGASTSVSYTPVKPLTPSTKATPLDAPSGDNNLTNPEQRILDAIAWFESIGIDAPKQPGVAFLAGYRYGAGGFNNPRSALRVKMLVEYSGNSIKLTKAGRELAHVPDVALTDEELQEKVFACLPTPEQKLLRPLIKAYPDEMTNEELAEQSGYTHGAGGFNNPRSQLRTLGLIEYRPAGRVRACDLLFPSSSM